MSDLLSLPAFCLAGFCVAVLGGCSNDSDRFFIVQNQVPSAGCIIPGTRSSTYLGSGILDVSLVSSRSLFGYRLFPLLQNDLPLRGVAGGGEPNRLTLRGFRVHLELAQNAPQAVVSLFAKEAMQPFLSFTEPWSGTVEPGGGTAPAEVTAVPAEVAHQIVATSVLDTLSSVGLVVRVRALGDTLAGSLESRELVYSIAACSGCLVNNQGPCPQEPAHTGNVCNLAQDNSVDCCSDGQSLICPSIAEPDDLI
jgi:hypothetical protein